MDRRDDYRDRRHPGGGAAATTYTGGQRVREHGELMRGKARWILPLAALPFLGLLFLQNAAKRLELGQ